LIAGLLAALIFAGKSSLFKGETNPHNGKTT
jgi:hypothetical protein